MSGGIPAPKGYTGDGRRETLTCVRVLDFEIKLAQTAFRPSESLIFSTSESDPIQGIFEISPLEGTRPMDQNRKGMLPEESDRVASRGLFVLGEGMDVQVFTAAEGMDSREIAERTGKQHAHVCRDIQTMIQELGIDESKFGSVYKGGNGESRRCYILPKRECLILATGYRVDLRAKIIDRWAELEAKTASQVPTNFADALQLAADQARTIEFQSKALEAAKPAVEFRDRYVEAKETQPIRAVAKILGIKERVFVAFLEERGILYRMSGRLTPAAIHLEKGRFEVKAGEVNGFAFAQVRFTTAGIEWVARKVGEMQAVAA